MQKEKYWDFLYFFKKKKYFLFFFIAHVITSNKTSFSSPFTGYLPAIFMGSTFNNYISYKSLLFSNMLCSTPSQGRIQDFKLGGDTLKKIAPSGERHEHFWGISCEKSGFYAKKIIFFPILAGAPPPRSAPASSLSCSRWIFCYIFRDFLTFYSLIVRFRYVFFVTFLSIATFLDSLL